MAPAGSTTRLGQGLATPFPLADRARSPPWSPTSSPVCLAGRASDPPLVTCLPTVSSSRPRPALDRPRGPVGHTRIGPAIYASLSALFRPPETFQKGQK